MTRTAVRIQTKTSNHRLTSPSCVFGGTYQPNGPQDPREEKLRRGISKRVEARAIRQAAAGATFWT